TPAIPFAAPSRPIAEQVGQGKRGNFMRASVETLYRRESEMAKASSVLIAGGGIGGLGAALGLARAGINTIVLERAPQFGEIGAGIQLGPNAFRSFDYLGVGEEARKLAVYVESLKLMDAISLEEI